ncbi:DotU/TssL family secretion system protein [Neisseriaceae bacterium ESL0693]|nr:DotU/TssL family secretion system protein [Neisseriaceae bacterium ESL0693]
MNNKDIPDYVRMHLRDYVLFVTRLGMGKVSKDISYIKSAATQIIDHFDQKLTQQQLSQEQHKQIRYALFALVDEVALRFLTSSDRVAWENLPLQVGQFDEYDAGVQLFEDIQTELAKPDPSLWLLSVWKLIFTLGFNGQYLFDEQTKPHELIRLIDQKLPAIVISDIKVNHKLRAISLRSFSAVGWSIILLIATVILYLVLNKYLTNLVVHIK